MVVVVAGFDDLPVADAHHEDGGQRVRLSAVAGSLVFELGDDDLGIGRLVDPDVAYLAARPGTGGEALHAPADLVPAAERGAVQRVERVNDVDLLRVELGQPLRVA